MPTYTKTRNMDSLFDFLTSCLTRMEGPCLWSPLHLPNPNNCPSPLRCLYVPAIQLFSPCLERLNACMIETHTGTLTRCLYLPGMPMEPHLCLNTPWIPIFVWSYPMEPYFCSVLPHGTPLLYSTSRTLPSLGSTWSCRHHKTKPNFRQQP